MPFIMDFQKNIEWAFPDNKKDLGKFIEILDDPKMGCLPNHLWRRAVELFLLAGREGNDGALPPIEEMA
jgi:hypothetical protein